MNKDYQKCRRVNKAAGLLCVDVDRAVVRRAHQLPRRSYIKARYWPPTASPTPCWRSTRPPISPSTVWSARSSAAFFVGACYAAASPRRRPTTLPFPPRPSPSRRHRPPVTPAVATAVGLHGRAARARPRFALWTPTSLQSLARTAHLTTEIA